MFLFVSGSEIRLRVKLIDEQVHTGKQFVAVLLFFNSNLILFWILLPQQNLFQYSDIRYNFWKEDTVLRYLSFPLLPLPLF